MNITTRFLVVSLAVATTGTSLPAVYADAISPAIKDKGKTYSKEPADVTFYGSGIGGRFTEASELRFEADRLLQDGELDKAIAKAKKACQLDPTDPESHMLMVRAMTRKLYQKNPIDEKLLNECMMEWRMLWLHNAEASEQAEAKFNYLRMLRIAHALNKQKQIEEKARDKAKQELAQQRADEAEKAAKPGATAKKASADSDKQSGNGGTKDASSSKETADGKDSDTKASADKSQPVEIAHKKKKFLLF